MITLLAHHLEAHHVPLFVLFFATGFYTGWQLFGRWLARRSTAKTARTGTDIAS
jgi:hypothetical protein